MLFSLWVKYAMTNSVNFHYGVTLIYAWCLTVFINPWPQESEAVLPFPSALQFGVFACVRLVCFVVCRNVGTEVFASWDVEARLPRQVPAAGKEPAEGEDKMG